MLLSRLYTLGIYCLILFIASCSSEVEKDAIDYTTYVDPLIGSGGHGHVFVGASVPHGMVQLGPNNVSKGWDWCSAYHASDSTIIGFSHTHLSGTGIADLADIILMPINNLPDTTSNFIPTLTYLSTFSKDKEYVAPGYYSVWLDKYNIKVELTSTTRVGFHRYSYPDDKEAIIIVDLDESAQSLSSRKGTLESYCQLLNDTSITGYRFSDEWAKDHKTFFNSVFSKPIKKSKIFKHNNKTKALLNFGLISEPLLVKTGISYVSEDGAIKNINTELPDWDFDKIRDRAKKQWNKELSKIDIQATADVMKIFYTSLYHTLIAPSIFSDVDGKYRGADGKIYESEGYIPYSTFSLWDTYRAVHPLYTLIDNRVSDYVNTLLNIYEQQGRMPVWHLVGNETDCMVGVHSIPVVVDACLKNIQNIDMEKAFKAVSSIANMDINGLKEVRHYGYIPADKIPWSVARGLEYAIDDYSVAMLAMKMGKHQDYQNFLKRSMNYQYYFDTQTNFMRGKLSNGEWRKEFDPSFSLHMEDDYIEGNAWQYTWLVPHDIDGLMKLFGGKQKFAQKLDSLFIVSSDLNVGASIDISGMIGQYAHGNEPSHHILYLYTYIGQPDKAAKYVRQVCENFYTTKNDGLIGNEDCGQMSAWYIFSALGFYPINPVSGTFVFGSPLVDNAILTLNNGNNIKIIAHNNSEENKYIQSIKLNGKLLDKTYINYSEIMKGGILEYQMCNKPM